jgi:hypothetical protein
MNMSIDYTHAANQHSIQAARAVLPVLLSKTPAKSLLDVGCGAGTWSRVALDLGIREVVGLDGVPIPAEELLIPKDCFRRQDLTTAWDLGRQFDLALCLEVAEHLDSQFAKLLIQSFAVHSKVIAFSAAAPGQVGQDHVNCRWPAYWQELFNAEGFTCDDSVRWEIWNEGAPEPWYRQNLFVAVHDPQRAGSEPRLQPVVHPEFLLGTRYLERTDGQINSMDFIETGGMPISWYLKLPLLGITSKLKRRIWQPATSGTTES